MMETRKPNNRRRGATLYVAVMGVGMIVGVIALTTSLTGRMQLRSNRTHVDTLESAAAAHSGVEFALNWINRTPSWRDDLTSGVHTSRYQTRNGSFVFRVTDTDGDLADDARDHAVLRVVGYQNKALYAVEVDLEPAGRALTCLEAAAHAGTDFVVDTSGILNGSGIASVGNDFDATGATINLPVEAVNSTSGGAYAAGTTEGVAAREMPGEHAFDWYLKNGTEIPISAFPNTLGTRSDSLNLYSRELNPHGDPNPRGIYWVDCQGEEVNLYWSRSLGTLILLNPGPDSRISNVCLFEAEAQNYPVLMVRGSIRLDLRDGLGRQTLFENFATPSYNSPGIPYEGNTDTDKSDEYPARLSGIVYATETITVTDDADVVGNLIANQIVVEDDETLKVDYTPYAYNYPPPGFSAGQGVRVLPGSYRRVDLNGG